MRKRTILKKGGKKTGSGESEGMFCLKKKVKEKVVQRFRYILALDYFCFRFGKAIEGLEPNCYLWGSGGLGNMF